MKGFVSSPLPAGGPRMPDFFERRKRTRGGSARSYTEGVHTPSRTKEEKKRLLVLLAVSVILPPLGILILWRMGIFRFPIRVAATFLAFALMVLYFSWMLPEETPEAYQPPVQRPGAITEYATPEVQMPIETFENTALY